MTTHGVGPAARSPAGRRAILAVVLLGMACASAGGGAPPPASEEEWRALALPRPEPLAGAARIAIAEVQLVGSVPWPADAAVGAELGLAELIGAGLLGRRDVVFVERRRFAEAARAERAGAPRPPGAPPAGVSPGADFVVTASWVRLGDDRGTVDARLADARSGAVVGSERVDVLGDADPVRLARTVVRAVLAALEEQGRLPASEDPVASAAGTIEIGAESLSRFLAGLAAEERWSWERARVAYQAAGRDPAFYEAEAALARTARLRLGGTLGEG